MGHVVRQI